MSVVVITGAAGLVGSMLRPRLARPGRTLRVLDIAPLTAGPDEEAIAASVTDMDAMTAACRGADAVIHLAGIPGEASWERISELNIGGSYVAFDAGRLFEACLTAERPGFRVAFGVSANTRGGWVSLAEAEALGYQPEDDAEAYAAEIIAEHGQPDPDDPVLRRLGGEFTLPYAQIPRR